MKLGAIHRLEDTFYASVLRDPLLQPLFGTGRSEHVEHLTAFTAEAFGGPDTFTRELGFTHLVAVHRGLKITEAQRKRFVELYVAAIDLPTCRPADRFRLPSRSDRTRRIRLAHRHAELPSHHRY